MNHSFEGFHGTSLESSKQILNSNFELSIGNIEWLGNGVYFFIDGISSKPKEQAEKWAIAQSWDNIQRKSKYNNYCVLQSNITVNENVFLDLTNENGIEVFEYLLNKFESKIKTLGKKLDFLDGLLINLARQEGIITIDVVKGNFYIKFAKERIERINLRTNNCTICSVFNPNSNIKNTKVLKIENIRHETF